MFLSIVLFVCISISILIIIYIQYYKEQLKKFKIEKKFNPKHNTKRRATGNVVYHILLRIPILREYVLHIRRRLFIKKPQDEYIIESKTTGIIFASFLISSILYVLIFNLYCKNAYLTVISFVAFIYLNNILTNRFLKVNEMDLLSNMPEFISDIKHHYHSTDMVDESIYEACSKARNNIVSQAKQIYKMITKSNGHELLNDYYDKCPNKFFKILAGFSYLIKEYGDKRVGGVSLYIKNMNYITEEINLEIIKSKQLSYWLKGLTLIAVTPLILPPLIENWMSSSFPAAKEFFDSSTAFFLKNLIIFLVILCCFMLLQIKKNEFKSDKEISENKIADYKLLEIRFIKKIIEKIRPKSNSLKYRNLEFLLKDAGSPLSIECVYLRKTVIGIVSFMVLICIFITSHLININTILGNASYKTENQNYYAMLGNIGDAESKQQKNVNAFDKEIMAAASKISNDVNGFDLKKAIKTELKKTGYKTDEIDVAAERIFNKISDKGKEKLSVLEILASIIFAFILSNIPIWVLIFRKSLRKVEMQDEVFQFHTIIILLMHHDNVDVQTILEWMYQFSDIFKEAINRCLNNFQNPYDALERLKEDVKYKPFSNLVENLQMAIDKINIISAFDSLELEREFYKENRKETNKQTVAKKIELGRFIGFIPFYSVIVLYMVFPLIFTSFMSLKSIIAQLNSI